MFLQKTVSEGMNLIQLSKGRVPSWVPVTIQMKLSVP